MTYLLTISANRWITVTQLVSISSWQQLASWRNLSYLTFKDQILYVWNESQILVQSCRSIILQDMCKTPCFFTFGQHIYVLQQLCICLNDCHQIIYKIFRYIVMSQSTKSPQLQCITWCVCFSFILMLWQKKFQCWSHKVRLMQRYYFSS